MKKDFSQPFIKEPTTIGVIVCDENSGQYLLLVSEEEWEKDFYTIVGLESKPESVSIALTKYLYALGLDITSFRELLRQTHIEYNVIDDTPGTEADELCVLAFVNKTDRTATKLGDQKLEWVAGKDLFDKLGKSPLMTDFLKTALARLDIDLG